MTNQNIRLNEIFKNEKDNNISHIKNDHLISKDVILHIVLIKKEFSSFLICR